VVVLRGVPIPILIVVVEHSIEHPLRHIRPRAARWQQSRFDRGLVLVEMGLIDEYEFMVQPRLAGHGPTLFAGLSKRVDLKLVSRLEFGSGVVAMRYEPGE